MTSAWRSIAETPPAPARISAAVELYEAQSERIIGWIQLAGVIFFAGLYLASYSAFALHHAIEPVPAFLLIYGAITLWRLHISNRGRLARWQQYASAAIDVAVLMALIASFPSQYAEPAALFLKAPTLFYVYILISLRALRLDPGLVLFTGAVAGSGWGALTLLAALDGAPLTGDYRVYMSSLSLLPGAELEKIAAILATSGILALAVDRARALLFRTAREEAATADLSKFIGRDAAALIRGSSNGVKAGDGEVRHAAIMFIDLRGFTSATRSMAPREVIALLQEYQGRLLPIIERGGGSVDKFLGDGILVSFGATGSTERECADAVETALAIFAEGVEWKAARRRAGLVPLDLAVALASGNIIYGAVGHGDRLEFTVIGDAVNLSAKLEKHAKVANAHVIATARIISMATAQGFDAEPVRNIAAARVEGVSEPVDLIVLA